MIYTPELIKSIAPAVFATSPSSKMTNKYEFVPTDETKKWYTMEDELVADRFDAYFAKYPLQHKRVLAGKIDRYQRPIEQKDPKLIAMEIAHENSERCRKLLFQIMSDHIDRWWD